MHDIYIPANPPYRTEIPVYHVNDRAGHISVKIDPKKITGVVRTNARDHIAAFTPQNETTLQIGHNVAAFLLREWKNRGHPQGVPSPAVGCGQHCQCGTGCTG